MRSSKLWMPTRKLILLSFITTAALLSSSCQHVTIKDEQFCSPIPGNLGAVCDNLLTMNQLVLTQAEWAAMQKQWLLSGQTTECTNSNTLGDIKAAIEKACSKTKCSYETKAAVNGLLRIIETRQVADSIYNERVGQDE